MRNLIISGFAVGIMLAAGSCASSGMQTVPDLQSQDNRGASIQDVPRADGWKGDSYIQAIPDRDGWKNGSSTSSPGEFPWQLSGG